MEKQKNRRTVLSVLRSPLGVIVITGVAILSAEATYKMYEKVREVSTLRASLSIEHRLLSQNRDRLTARLGELETDEGAEALYREKFPVKKPGESVVVFLEEEMTPIVASTTPTIWERIGNLFGF